MNWRESREACDAASIPAPDVVCLLREFGPVAHNAADTAEAGATAVVVTAGTVAIAAVVAIVASSIVIVVVSVWRRVGVGLSVLVCEMA